ncbi:hypothetical protein NEOLEDRAFT_408224 [Neolentinus lepideus HHB14362 ss-1]|uniref:Uncharacterized protein n=1 Tax=Neolentinus lepideus HHB14362 ss-1 TaxID=1314782 RepID=A0A165S4H7_9AGAM|nr:hypothetical protein NEOLEDRAFT_408224 [Neolentinus lepideus HHB14362 ss-1]
MDSPPANTSQPCPLPSSPRSPSRPPPSSFPRFLERTISGNPKSFLDINDDADDTTAFPRPSFSSSIFSKPLHGRPGTPAAFNTNIFTATPGPESGHRDYSFPDPHPYSSSTSSPRRTAHPIRSLFTSKSTGHFPKPSKPLDVADYAAPLSRLNSGSSVLSTYTAPRPVPPKPEGAGYVDLYGRRPSAPEDYAYVRAREKEAMKALPPIPVRPRASSQASLVRSPAGASYKSKTGSRSKMAAVFPPPLQVQISRTRKKSGKSPKTVNVYHPTRQANGSSSTSSSGTATPTPVTNIKRHDPAQPFFHLAARQDDSVPPVPPLPSPPLTKSFEAIKYKRSRTRSGSVTSQISEVLSAGLAGLGVGSRAKSKSKESVMHEHEEEQEKEDALNIGRVFTPEDDPFKKDVVEVSRKKGSGYSAVSSSGSSEEEGKRFVPPRMRGLGLDVHPYASVPPLWGGPSPTTPPMMPPPTGPLPEIPHLQGLPTPPSSSVVPPSQVFEAEEREKAFVYPPPATMLPTPPMTGTSGRRQSFIDMDEGSLRRVRHVPTLEEVRDRKRTRSGSPFPLHLGCYATEDDRLEEQGIEEGQSRVVFSNPWMSGEGGRGSSDRDSAVDVEWPLPPRRVVTVVVDGEDGEKEGGWHDVEQGVEVHSVSVPRE